MREMATESPPSQVADPGMAQDVVTHVKAGSDAPRDVPVNAHGTGSLSGFPGEAVVTFCSRQAEPIA